MYGSQIWGQIRSSHFVGIERPQKKAIKILNFAIFREFVTSYKVSKIFNLSDNI